VIVTTSSGQNFSRTCQHCLLELHECRISPPGALEKEPKSQEVQDKERGRTDGTDARKQSTQKRGQADGSGNKGLKKPIMPTQNPNNIDTEMQEQDIQEEDAARFRYDKNLPTIERMALQTAQSLGMMATALKKIEERMEVIAHKQEVFTKDSAILYQSVLDKSRAISELEKKVEALTKAVEAISGSSKLQEQDSMAGKHGSTTLSTYFRERRLPRGTS
jgi:archaellum component FlaC